MLNTTEPKKYCIDKTLTRKYILWLSRGYKAVGLLKENKLNALTKSQILKLIVNNQEEFLNRVKKLQKKN